MAAIIGISNPAGILTGGTQSITAEAASKPKMDKVEVCVLSSYKNQPTNQVYITFSKLSSTNVTVKNLKSSNKKVVTVGKPSVSSYVKSLSIPLTFKKAGSAYISFDLKIGKKTYSYKKKVSAVKYTNPMKSFKIGKTEFASRYKKYAGPVILNKALSGKLKIVPNKNWKIIFMDKMTLGEGSSKVKNNTKIVLKRPSVLTVVLQNKKTGAVSSIALQIH
ncbi:MAG: hypothetical protein Q4F83_03915 [Eubacteriales bacterium]|nr:hypothetical protein [Eubacteriales bacterium]